MAPLLSLSPFAIGPTSAASTIPLAFAFHSKLNGFAHSKLDQLSPFATTPNLHRVKTLRPSKCQRRHHQLLSSRRNNADTISEMPLVRLLQLLQQYNIRYGPNSTREQLEDLLSRVLLNEDSANDGLTNGAQGEYRKRNMENAETADRSKNDVMDAIVVEPEQQQNSYSNGPSRRKPESRSRRRRRRSDVSRERNGYSTNGYTRGDDNFYQDSQIPRNRQRQYRSNKYTHYEDIKDVDFDLSNPSRYKNKSKGPYYENGLQIFLMGFMEVGKTAAELAMDAAKNNLPFADEGDWWFDEENGRDVLDVNVLDCRRVGYEDGRRPKPRNRRRRVSRREWEDGYEADRQSDGEISDLDYQSSASFVPLSEQVDQLQDLIPDRPESGSAQRRRRVPSRSRIRVDEVGNPKPMYGLYNGEDAALHDNEDTSDRIEQPHYHRQQWKDRLRTKFDAALGLESPLEQHEYYDSWKRNMERMKDGHKQRLRDKMNDEEPTKAAVPSGDSTSSGAEPVQIPRNRRARMRALKKGNLNEANLPPSHRTKSEMAKIARKKRTGKVRLEEEPFWKDRGSIASVLFDNRPSSLRTSMKKRRNTLEQLLLSPLGRERTLTSLLLYISRSSLSVFGNICRWAGVRGTIPQPIVVVTVCAVLLSSYRQQRVFSLGLTLLAIRMLGEFMHGSVHGNEFWDDEYDEKNHEWVIEDDVNDAVA